MELIVATNNAHKVTEFRNKLSGFSIYALKDKGIEIEIEEDGKTFEENAVKKARTISDLTGKMVIADDSGLEVLALNNAPGIYSARYGGAGLSDEERYQKLLADMRDKTDRRARFVTVIAICYPNGKTVTLRGECKGSILTEPQGTGGFGYDPVFYYEPLRKTFGDLSLDEKNQVSHRARALEKLKRYFQAEACVIESEQLCAEVVSRGAEIRRLQAKKDGADLLNRDLKSWDYCAPVLFPVLGTPFDKKGYSYKEKYYEIEPHGFARCAQFSLCHWGENTVTYALEESGETLKSYPFPFRLEITHTLRDNSLHTTYRVHNTGSEALFFNIGSHEAYAIGSDYENYTVVYEKSEDLAQYMLRSTDASDMPEASNRFGAAEREICVQNPTDKALTRYYFSTNLNSEWVQLCYKGDPKVRLYFDSKNTKSLGFWNKPNSKFYCMEPWCGIADAYQGTIKTEDKREVEYLEPGGVFETTHKMEFFV